MYNIAAEDLGPARVWLEQRRKHPDERRLTGPVGAEQRKDRSLGDLQVYAGQGRRRTEALDNALDVNGGT